VNPIMRWASRLRFKQLFFLVAALFVLDLFLVDPIPLLDEALFGFLTLLFGSMKKSIDENTPIDQ